MRFGINTFLFSCPFTDASTRLFPKFKKWGFESVEISVEDFAHLDPERFKAQLEKHGLVCGSVTPCLGPDKDLRGTERQWRGTFANCALTPKIMGASSRWNRSIVSRPISSTPASRACG